VRWNRALEGVAEIEARIERHVNHASAVPAATLGDFTNLAGDLKAIWQDPVTDVRLKKRIVRTLIRDVIADIDTNAAEIVLVVHWTGGIHTELRLRRRRRGNCTSTSKDIVEAVRSLVRICGDDLIAGVLNRNDLRTGRGNRWTRERVTSLRSHHKIPVHDPEIREAEGWLNLTQAAAMLGVSPKTLRLAAEQGEIPAEHPLADSPWVFNRASLQTDAAARLTKRARSRCGPPAGPRSEQQSLFLSMT
jgi:hypothetical protein